MMTQPPGGRQPTFPSMFHGKRCHKYLSVDIDPQITLIDADLFSGTCGKVKTCENHPWFILLKHVLTGFTTTIL